MFDRIYTVGCFDYFHYGHEKMFTKMKEMGKTIIVGIHDDDSIEKLKNLDSSSHQNIKVRMDNVKKHADIIYVIPDTDPTFFLKCIVLNEDNKENACFVRGDDMQNFPGKEFIDNKMEIKFLPYTHGISSTEIRNNLI